MSAANGVSRAWVSQAFLWKMPKSFSWGIFREGRIFCLWDLKFILIDEGKLRAPWHLLKLLLKLLLNLAGGFFLP